MLKRVVIAAGTTLAASLVLAGTAAAQTGVLAGAVFAGDSRTGLEGATITIVGTKLSAVTGKDGRFVIADVPAGDLELRIRRVEFASHEDRVRVAAGDTTHAYYELVNPDAERRSRVFVRSDRDTLAGESHVEFMVREPLSSAAKKPLIIVDGVILFDGDDYVKTMDPKGVESIEVIKGELAKEKYGPRAGDGVIMIRTKTAPPPPPAPQPPPLP